MATLGNLDFGVRLVDSLTAPLKKVQTMLNSVTADVSKSATSFLKLGGALGGTGIFLKDLSPGLEEVGKLFRGAGAGVTAFSAVLEAPEALIGFADSVKNLQTAFSATGILAKTASSGIEVFDIAASGGAVAGTAGAVGVTTLAGAFTVLMGALLPILPILLAIAAVAFIIYTLWTENFMGIQEVVMGVMGDISGVIYDVIEYAKGYIIGFFEMFKPIFSVVIFILKGVGAAFRMLSDAMAKSGGAFEIGKKAAVTFNIGLLPLRATMWLLTPLFRLLGNAVEKAGGAGEVMKKAFMWLTPIGMVVRALQALWAEFGDSITAAFSKVWEALKPIVEPIEKLIDKIKELIDWYGNLGKTQEEIAANAEGGGLGYEGMGEEGSGLGIYGSVPMTSIPGGAGANISNRSATANANVYTGPISSGIDIDMLANTIAKRQKAELESLP